MALTTPANVRLGMGLQDSQNADDDTYLAQLIASVTTEFEVYTGRALASAARTESQVYRGRGLIITPRYYPVTDVTSVTIDGTAVAAAGSWAGTGWYLLNDQIHLRGTEVENGSLVALAYTAGYETVPSDLERAAVESVILKFKERGHVGASSMNAAGMSVSFLPSMMPNTVRQVLDAYRVPAVA